VVTVLGVEWIVKVTTPLGTVVPDKIRGLSDSTLTGFVVSSLTPDTVTVLVVGVDGGWTVDVAVGAMVVGLAGVGVGVGVGGGGVVKATLVEVLESPHAVGRQPCIVTLPTAEDVSINEALPLESVTAEAGLAVAVPDTIFTTTVSSGYAVSLPHGPALL
jgi:hypothetical protein